MVGDIFPTSLPPPSLKCVSSSLKLYGIWLLLIGRRDLLRIFDSISQLVLRAYSSAFVHVENLLYLLYSISYYLDMNPAENTATVCTGQSKNIFCPALQLLKVKSAYYGKQAHRDCSGQYTADPAPTCYARDTLQAVKEMCDGQQSCDLYAEPDLYGQSNCAPDTQKYLQVVYFCDGHSDLTKQLNPCKYTYVFINVYRYFKQTDDPVLVQYGSLCVLFHPFKHWNWFAFCTMQWGLN